LSTSPVRITVRYAALTSERGEEARFSSTEERADLAAGGVMELTGPRPMPWPEGTGSDTGTLPACVAAPPSALRRRPSNADCRDRSELELPPPSAALAFVSAAPNACEGGERCGDVGLSPKTGCLA
jgi:hypothetical protein